jgi:hypothetical protein
MTNFKRDFELFYSFKVNFRRNNDKLFIYCAVCDTLHLKHGYNQISC